MDNKKSTSEVGHVKNVANLKVMIKAVSLFTNYNPVNPKITVAELQNKYDESKAQLKNVDQKQALDNDAVNQRQYAFQKLEKLTTRVINSAEVITEDKKLMDDIDTFVDKIRGVLATPQTDDDQEGQETAEVRSNSQQSYDNLAAHFGKILEHLEITPAYVPNETDITLQVLKAYLEELLQHNEITAGTLNALKAARRDRDKVMYNDDEGLYQRTLTVKKYIKSLFGANTPESDQISGIEFTDYIRKKKK